MLGLDSMCPEAYQLKLLAVQSMGGLAANFEGMGLSPVSVQVVDSRKFKSTKGPAHVFEASNGLCS